MFRTAIIRNSDAALSTVVKIVLDFVTSTESAVSTLDSASAPADVLTLVQANIAVVESAVSALANSYVALLRNTRM